MKRLVTILLLFTAFVTDAYPQSKQKNTFAGRTYHNTTARYNGYFNAKMLFEETVDQLIANREDDYDEILEVYPFVAPEKAQQLTPDMDIVIEKTSKVIQKHEISKWTDDSYLLMAKAYYFKGDHESAKNAILVITSEYKDGRKSKSGTSGSSSKNTVQQFADKYKLTHQPVYYEAIIWLIHSYIASGDIDKAKVISDLIKINQDTPDDLKADVSTIQAYLFIKSKEYDKAIPKLEQAIELIRDKKLQGRYTYILAQLNNKIGNNSMALKHYNRVLYLQPSFDMEFNAKISIARSFEGQGGILSLKEVKETLLELSKDDKNIDYLDRIYYALAEVALKEGSKPLAEHYLHKSIEANVSNDKQLSLSYLELGKINFKDAYYVEASYYYDSTVNYLPKDHNGYDTISQKQSTLSNLVNQIEIIEKEDSLQKVAKMPERKRNELIDEIIEKKKFDEELNQQKEEQPFNPIQTQKPPTPSPKGRNAWYFYNSTAKNLGYTDFINKWGKRKLEDNWRRKNKSQAYQSSENIASNEPLPGEDDPYSPDYYYKDLPLSEEKMEISKNKIVDAYYKMAFIFKDELNNEYEAIKALEKLNKRYASHKYIPQTYYFLHLMHNNIGNKKEAGNYKDNLIKYFPDSDYAKLLKNDGYNNHESLKSPLAGYYENTYNYYKIGNYELALNKAKDAQKYYPDNNLLPRFKYISALSYWRLEQKEKMISELQEIIEQYPDDPVKEEAENLLNYINDPEPAGNNSVNNSGYRYEANNSHFYILIMENNVFIKSNLTVELANFNEKFHKGKNYKISNIKFNDNEHIILVKSFDDSKEGKNYYKSVLNDPEVSGKVTQYNLKHYIISNNNFKTLIGQTNIDPYEAFYHQHYK